MVNALRARGWLPESDNPANAVRAALDRLWRSPDADVCKYTYANGTVRYAYDPDLERTTVPQDPDPGFDEEPF